MDGRQRGTGGSEGREAARDGGSKGREAVRGGRQ